MTYRFINVVDFVKNGPLLIITLSIQFVSFFFFIIIFYLFIKTSDLLLFSNLITISS